MVESIARVRHIRVTPQKARRVVALIKGKQAQEALAILKFAQQSASEPTTSLSRRPWPTPVSYTHLTLPTKA